MKVDNDAFFSSFQKVTLALRWQRAWGWGWSGCPGLRRGGPGRGGGSQGEERQVRLQRLAVS